MKPKEETGARAALRAKGYVPAVEAAGRIGFVPQTIYDWLNEKKIQGVRLGRERWVEWRSLVKHFKDHAPEAARALGIQ